MTNDRNTPETGKILSISGKPGLYKMIAQAKNGIIVESITDHKRFQVFAHDKVSALDEISVFTQGEDMPVKEIFRRIHEKTEAQPAPDPKADNKVIVRFFEEVVPEYDRERVYVSHMKKIFSWYNLVLEHNLIDLTAGTTETGQQPPEEILDEPPADESNPES